MATSRRVPVPRGSGAGRNAARPVSHPGIEGSGAPAFQSPFQPPHGYDDLMLDVSLLDPAVWHPLPVAGEYFRARVAMAGTVQRVNEALTGSGMSRLGALHAFLTQVMHPEDFTRMLHRMLDPDDEFGVDEMTNLFRQCVSLGTARPFVPSPSSSPSPPRTGAPSARGSFWAGWAIPSARSARSPLS